MNEMTKEQFLLWVKANFSAWAGSDPRSKSSWLVSLKRFAEINFDKAYEQDFPKDRS